MTFVFICLLLLSIVAANKENGLWNNNNKPWCHPDILPLGNASKGEFFLLPDGAFRYEFPHCKMRRFNAETAGKCLQGAHLVFMGDSVSRYFYLSLAYLFAQNKWPHKFARIPAHANAPRSIVSEQDYQNWPFFYKESNALLSSKHSFELCDCYHDESAEGDRNGAKSSSSIENRHFRYMPKGDYDDQNHDVRLSYLHWTGDRPIRGHSAISHYPRDHTFPSFLTHLNEHICIANADAEPPKDAFKVISGMKDGKAQYETIHSVGSTATAKKRLENKQQQLSMSFSPLTLDCAWTRNDLLDSDFPMVFNNSDCPRFPKEIDEYCQHFERKILAPLGTTHLIVNIAERAGLHHFQPFLLDKLVDAAETYFAIPGRQVPNSLFPIHTGYWGDVFLPKITWRSSTARTAFAGDDQLAKEYADQVGIEKFSFFDIYDMTNQLYTINELIVAKDKEGLRKKVKIHHQYWTREQKVDYGLIPTIYVDDIHVEPWVYTEFHNVFLNSICPLTK